MFTVIRKYKVQRGASSIVAQRARESFVPLLRSRPGFRGYHMIESGPDVIVSVTTFDTAEEALASSELAAAWVRDNVLEFTKGVPEYMVGSALIAEVKEPAEAS